MGIGGGRGESYESKKGLIEHGGCECQTTRSYSDRCSESMSPRLKLSRRAISCMNQGTGRGQDIPE